MRYQELVETHHRAGPIYRWVDEKAVKSYLRANAMIGRWRHYLPAKVSGLHHSKFQTGLSFSTDDRRWSVAGNVCFVVDRAKLDVPSYDLNGQAIYTLSDMIDLIKNGGGVAVSRSDYEAAVRHAIEDSRNDPDEVFVVPAVRDLAAKLIEIRHTQVEPKTLDLLRSYCDQHGVPLRPAER